MRVSRKAVSLAAMVSAIALATAVSGQQPPPQTPATTQQPATAPSDPASVQTTNDAAVQEILKQIAGHEQEPAEKVFKNIQLEQLKKTPAARFLTIMNVGYSRALGVACSHCHVETDFSSDDKRPKRAAREMAAMHRSINEQLNKMQNLQPKPQGTFINCTTCHRGAVDPTATTK